MRSCAMVMAASTSMHLELKSLPNTNAVECLTLTELAPDVKQHDECNEEQAQDKHGCRSNFESWRVIGVEFENARAAATARARRRTPRRGRLPGHRASRASCPRASIAWPLGERASTDLPLASLWAAKGP